MNAHPCSDSEMALISAAKRSLRQLQRPGKNTVVAGVLTDCGRMYLGVDVLSSESSACAEPSAISQAHFDGFYAITAVAAVGSTSDNDEIVVISPCVACTDLISYQHPEARVVVPGPMAVSADDLLASGGVTAESAQSALASQDRNCRRHEDNIDMGKLYENKTLDELIDAAAIVMGDEWGAAAEAELDKIDDQLEVLTKF